MTSIDEEKCIGCGLCISICEEIFEMNQNIAKIKSNKKSPCLKDAIEQCPTDAILE